MQKLVIENLLTLDENVFVAEYGTGHVAQEKKLSRSPLARRSTLIGCLLLPFFSCQNDRSSSEKSLH